MRYVSKPTECEALQWNGEKECGKNAHDWNDIVAWVNANGGEARYDACPCGESRCESIKYPRIAVRTINGWVYAAPGDYIVMGSAMFARDQFRAERLNPVPVNERCRDFYPCDPEIFEKRWVAASGQGAPE